MRMCQSIYVCACVRVYAGCVDVCMRVVIALCMLLNSFYLEHMFATPLRQKLIEEIGVKQREAKDV